MKPSSCLNPQYIKCKDGIFRSVPCGKCAACIVNKGFYKTNRIKDYIQGYPYQFLVTLTFEDKYLPLARYDAEHDMLVHDIDTDFDGVIYSYQLSEKDEKDFGLLEETLNKFGGVPVLSHRVMINFKKRLRYYLKKYGYGEDVFLYGCGEYGPTTFRPHSHFICGFRENIPTSLFKECVSQAWSFHCKVGQKYISQSFGFIDVQRSFGKKSIDYIAKYLCCTTHLPSYLSLAKWKPFSCGSTKCSEQLSRLSQANLREVYNNPTSSVRVLRNGKYVHEPVPMAYKCRYFPVIGKFNLFNDYELYQIYRLYQKYPDSKSAYEDFCLDCNKEIPWDSVLEYNKPFDGRNTSIMPLSIMQQGVIEVCFKTADGEEIFDEFIKKRNFMRLYYVSRRVCFNSKELDVSVSTYVDKIIEYYNQVNFEKLRNFYEYQNEIMSDIFNPVSLDYIFTMYYHTDKSIDVGYYSRQFNWHGIKLGDSSQQRVYKDLREGILRDTSKTKKRNDKFNSLGLVHKKFVPRISHKINNFLSY